ncbi:MAG: hypothetical protein ACXWWL_05055 [Candidatus Limnocylindria bacterium]
MTERERAGGGGLTGATGDLTFEENDRPFVTGETREAADPERKADVTTSQGRAPASPSPGGGAQVGGDQLTGSEEHL